VQKLIGFREFARERKDVHLIMGGNGQDCWEGVQNLQGPGGSRVD
jgi:hypothetical protein